MPTNASQTNGRSLFDICWWCYFYGCAIFHSCVFFLLLLQLLLLVCFLLWCEGATRQIFTERYAQDYNWISYIMSVTRVNAGLLAASYLPNLYTRLHLNQVNAHETKWFLATSCCIQWNSTMEFHTCLSNRF